MNIKHSGMWLLGLVACGSVSGCPDPKSRLADWRERSEEFRKEPEAGECAGIADISGTYLLGVAVVINKSLPLRFKLDIEVDAGGGTIDASMQAYAIPPYNGETVAGTLVGEVFTASSAIDSVGGTFRLDFGSVTVPVPANPLLENIAPVADLVLVGCTGSVEGSCGLVEGQITYPTTLPLAGSTWAITPLEDPLSDGIEAGCE